MELEFGKLPDTVEQITGSGGRHLLFKYPEDVIVPCRVNIRPGIDIRGDGGYIIVEPSKHIRGEYCWEVSSHPLDVPIAEAPKWLIELVAEKPVETKKPLDFWWQIAKGVKEGRRNVSAASLMGLLLSSGIDPLLSASLVYAWNKCFNKPPLSDQEILKVVDSIAKRELEKIKNVKKLREGE